MASMLEAIFGAIQLDGGDGEVDKVMERLGLLDLSRTRDMVDFLGMKRSCIQEPKGTSSKSSSGRTKKGSSRRRQRTLPRALVSKPIESPGLRRMHWEIVDTPNIRSGKSASPRDPEDRDWEGYPTFKTTEKQSWWARIFG